MLLRAFAGSITATGTKSRQTNKALAGSSTSSGAVAKRPAKALTGGITAAGSVAKLARKALSGAVAALGALTRLFIGGGTPAGDLTPGFDAVHEQGLAVVSESDLFGIVREQGTTTLYE